MQEFTHTLKDRGNASEVLQVIRSRYRSPANEHLGGVKGTGSGAIITGRWSNGDPDEECLTAVFTSTPAAITVKLEFGGLFCGEAVQDLWPRIQQL